MKSNENVLLYIKRLYYKLKIQIRIYIKNDCLYNHKQNSITI